MTIVVVIEISTLLPFSGSVLRIWNEDVLAPIDELRGLEYERLPGVKPVRKGGQHLSTSFVQAWVGIALEPPDGDAWRIHRLDELLKTSSFASSSQATTSWPANRPFVWRTNSTFFCPVRSPTQYLALDPRFPC
jgi:hypothetical protein